MRAYLAGRMAVVSGLVAMSSALGGCGSGGSSSESELPRVEPVCPTGCGEEQVITARFVDSPVTDLTIESDLFATPVQLTDERGRFRARFGEEVQVWAGEVYFGSLVIGRPSVSGLPAHIRTPFDFGERLSEFDPEVYNRVRLLLTFDEDGDPDNGVQLVGITEISGALPEFNFGDDAVFEVQAQEFVQAFGGEFVLVDADTALNHLTNSVFMLREEDYQRFVESTERCDEASLLGSRPEFGGEYLPPKVGDTPRLRKIWWQTFDAEMGVSLYHFRIEAPSDNRCVASGAVWFSADYVLIDHGETENCAAPEGLCPPTCGQCATPKTSNEPMVYNPPDGGIYNEPLPGFDDRDLLPGRGYTVTLYLADQQPFDKAREADGSLTHPDDDCRTYYLPTAWVDTVTHGSSCPPVTIDDMDVGVDEMDAGADVPDTSVDVGDGTCPGSTTVGSGGQTLVVSRELGSDYLGAYDKYASESGPTGDPTSGALNADGTGFSWYGDPSAQIDFTWYGVLHPDTCEIQTAESPTVLGAQCLVAVQSTDDVSWSQFLICDFPDRRCFADLYCRDLP